MHIAARWGRYPAVIGALLDGGADPMALDGEGELPYEKALENENLEGTEALQRLKDATVLQDR